MYSDLRLQSKYVVLSREKDIKVDSKFMEWLTVPNVFSFATGSFVAGLIAIYFNLRRQKLELAFKVLEQFFDRHTELGEVMGLLQEPEGLKEPVKLNRVLALGDWYEMVATMCNKNIINARIIRKMGIDIQMESFRSAARDAGDLMKDAIKTWNEMRTFVKSKGEEDG